MVPRLSAAATPSSTRRPYSAGRSGSARWRTRLSYPVEHMAAATPQANPEATSAIYDALAVHAGVRRLVTADDRRVACDVLVRSDGARFVWLVSQASEPVTVKPELAPGLWLARLDGSAADGAATLAPFGVGVFRLEVPPAATPPTP